MKPISEEFRTELRYKMLNSDRCEKSSEKTKSYLNIFSKSIHDGFKAIKQNKVLGLIAKIYQNQKTFKYHLLKYNAVKGERSDVLLEAFISNKMLCKRIAVGKRSGYYFLYDNQGTISVISENVKICELNLPDSRVDPTLFVFEIEFNRILLFIAGGFLIRGSNSSSASDSIAVFFLNFKDSSKLLTNEPLLYIKMKYRRMHPIVLLHKNDTEKMLIIIGGNLANKFKEDKNQTIKKKSTVGIHEANMMCETIRINKIKDSIFESNGENTPIITTDDCLCLIVNGKEDNQSKNPKIMYHLGDAGVLRITDRKKHKIYFILGLGKDKKEIWYIDMFDFIEHKAYIYQSQGFLKGNKGRVLCNLMMTKVGDDIYYLDDDETTQYKKLSIKKLKNNMINNCNIF